MRKILESIVLLIIFSAAVLIYDRSIGSSAQKHPVILFSWNETVPHAKAQKMVERITSFGGIPYKYDYLDSEIDPEKLKNETDELIIGITFTSGGPSIPQQLFAKVREANSQEIVYPEIAKILTKAKAYVASVDAVLIPGGWDIHPIFYGQERHPKTGITNDYRRDLFEFAILEQLDNTNLPLLAICRGAQITNIWNGGTLHQHVDEHMGTVDDYFLSNPISQHSYVKELFEQSGNEIQGYASHHQCMDQIGCNLTVMAESNKGIIAALEKLGDRYYVLYQWHPEFKGDRSTPEAIQLDDSLSNANLEIFKQFIKVSQKTK